MMALMQSEDTTPDKKSPAGDNPLYSLRGISVATFFGGPIAAGMMMRKNFVNLGRASEGRLALGLSLAFTAFLLGSLYMIPETVIDKIPGSVFPAFICAAVYQLVKMYQGQALHQHESVDGPLYSGMRIFGVTVGSVFITLALIVATILAFDPTLLVDESEAYDRGFRTVLTQEKIGLGVYPLLESGDTKAVVEYIDGSAMPAWKAALEELKKMEKMSVHEQSQEQAREVGRYVELRIESLELIKKSIVEDTDKYDKRLDEVLDEINKQD